MPGLFTFLQAYQRVTGDLIGKSSWREILSQIKVWKTQEYFVYFKFYKPQSCDKRSVRYRRQSDQRLLKNFLISGTL